MKKKSKSKSSFKIIVTESITAFKEIFMQMHTLSYNKTDENNSFEIQNEGNMEVQGIINDYKQTGTLNDTFLKWSNAFLDQDVSNKQMKKLHSSWRQRFAKTIIQTFEDNYYITNNDLVRFIEYFKIGIVIIKDYANPDKQFKDEKYFISDCNFNILKQKHIFTYCDYFMIIGYFDNMHFDIFYNQETKRAIYSTKEGKERDFVRRLCDEQNLEYFFGEKNDSDYERG